MNITAEDLKMILDRVPGNTPIVVIEGDDYEHKKTVLSPYVSTQGELVIQFWN